jgi:uncharacterized membrane protein
VSTIELTRTVTVDAPAASAWALVADYRRDVEWRSGVLSMDPTPADLVKVGTTTTERIRAGGRTYVNDGLVTDLDPDRRFSWRTTSGVDADGRRSIEPLDDGRCTIRLELRVRPSGFDRALTPFLRPMLRNSLRKDLDRLRALLETA